MNERCIACGNEFDPTRDRRMCCDGRDCACMGSVLPDEFCSLRCYENNDLPNLLTFTDRAISINVSAEGGYRAEWSESAKQIVDMARDADDEIERACAALVKIRAICEARKSPGDGAITAIIENALPGNATRVDAL